MTITYEKADTAGVLRGTATDERVPVVELLVNGREWRAVIDTGFNGYLELPEGLRAAVKAQFIGHLESALAAGQTIVEENFIVEFPFDGETLEVEATDSPPQPAPFPLASSGFLRLFLPCSGPFLKALQE